MIAYLALVLRREFGKTSAAFPVAEIARGHRENGRKGEKITEQEKIGKSIRAIGYSTRRVIGAPQHRSAINGLPVISTSFLSPLYIHGCKTLIRAAIKDRNAYITRTGGGIVYTVRRAQNTRRRRARGGIAGTSFLRSNAITTPAPELFEFPDVRDIKTGPDNAAVLIIPLASNLADAEAAARIRVMQIDLRFISRFSSADIRIIPALTDNRGVYLFSAD